MQVESGQAGFSRGRSCGTTCLTLTAQKTDLQRTSGAATFTPMKHPHKKTSMKEQLEEAILEIGGEPLQGSGFNDEKPEEAFSAGVLLDSTLLPESPTTFRSRPQ